MGSDQHGPAYPDHPDCIGKPHSARWWTIYIGLIAFVVGVCFWPMIRHLF